MYLSMGKPGAWIFHFAIKDSDLGINIGWVVKQKIRNCSKKLDKFKLETPILGTQHFPAFISPTIESSTERACGAV